VGKSTWLKTLLSQLCKKYPADSILYASCEQLSDSDDLAHFLEVHRHRKVILLDEVTFVKHWDRAIKHFVDSKPFEILIATGSNSADLRRGADTMPGRFRGGGEHFLRPMDFSEFASVRASAGWSKPTRIEELQTYFRVGGFPSVVIEAGKDGTPSESSLENIWRWLVGDARKLGRSEQYLREMLGQLALTLQSN
jgi:predicted AAA+ superfamily ATPase